MCEVGQNVGLIILDTHPQNWLYLVCLDLVVGQYFPVTCIIQTISYCVQNAEIIAGTIRIKLQK